MAYAYSGSLLVFWHLQARHTHTPNTHTHTHSHKWPLKFPLSTACGQQAESCAFASRILPSQSFCQDGSTSGQTLTLHTMFNLWKYILFLGECVCGSVYLWQKVIDIVIDGTLGRQFLGLWLDMMTNYAVLWPMNFSKRVFWRSEFPWAVGDLHVGLL